MRNAKLSFAAVLGGAAITLAPLVASAQNNSNTNNSHQQHASGPQQLVNESISVVHRMNKDPHLRALLARSKGVLIFPTFGEGGFIVGGKGGEGVLLVRQNGRWSNPVFYNLAGGSIGAQVGGEGGPIAYVLRSDNAVRDLIGNNNVSLNAKAGFTIATWSGKAQGNIGKANVVLWSGAKGAMAKAAVGVTDISQNYGANDQYYRAHHVTAVAILQGRVSNPGATPLRMSLPA